MSNVAPHLSFDKAHRFPGVWLTTKTAIEALMALVLAPYAVDAHATAVASIEAIGDTLLSSWCSKAPTISKLASVFGSTAKEGAASELPSPRTQT
ncbi:hypothetical protein JCM5296_002737, partial [Sporobolomyces johnsonii]